MTKGREEESPKERMQKARAKERRRKLERQKAQGRKENLRRRKALVTFVGRDKDCWERVQQVEEPQNPGHPQVQYEDGEA